MYCPNMLLLKKKKLWSGPVVSRGTQALSTNRVELILNSQQL